jgi:hypothetical protein
MDVSDFFALAGAISSFFPTQQQKEEFGIT